VTVPFGDSSLLVEVGATARVHALAEALRSEAPHGIRECVPGLDSLLVEFDPLVADDEPLAALVEERLAGLPVAAPRAGRHRSIPVLYGGEMGPDLDEVAELLRLTPDAVVALHARTELEVVICGFAPGFAYLGELPAELAVPRLATPRTHTPAGSVAIAGRQSGIYPADLPGGWRILGRTPISIFDPTREPPTYLGPGDRVSFMPIRPDEWERVTAFPADW